MVHYMCCNSSMLLEKNIHMPYSMHMAKVIKSYMTDIDAREFKEFDDELDVDIIKIEKERFNYSTVNNNKQILLIISIRICHFFM